MSMLDSFFKQGFKASKCKTLLKLTIPRIKLLRNRRDIHLKQMRREIAKLLETGQEATARIRVEHIIREENMMAAQEILELFCELIAVRLPIIESQRECPLDLKEAISSVCFAAPRCADLPELLQVQLLFASKYGKEFVSAATELMPSCGVNRQLIELLSVRAPSPEKKLKLLKEIAEEHGLEWDPAASETEFFKPHEDLLNGPTKFVSGSELSLPNEKHDEAQDSVPEHPHKEQADFDSDSDLDDLLLPEVPKVSVRATSNFTSEMPEAVPHPEIDDKSSVHSGVAAELKQQPYGIDEEATHRISADDKDEAYSSPCPVENKQFLPFLTPPSVSTAPLSSVHTSAAYSSSQSSTSFPAGSDSSPHTLPRKKSESNVDLQDSSSLINTSFPAGSDNSPHTLPRKKSEANVDLQDVIAAAQAAAETAERAAAAARSAASLAQARIGELNKNNSANILEASYENPFHVGTSDQADTAEPRHFSDQSTSNDSDGVSRGYSATQQDYGSTGGFENSMASFDKFKADFDSSLPYDHLTGDSSASHQPQRLPSMEDETYLSYPNLFSSQNSFNGSHSPRNIR